MSNILSISEVTDIVKSALSIIESSNNSTNKTEAFIKFITKNKDNFIKPIYLAGRSIVQFLASSTNDQKCVILNKGTPTEKKDCNFCISRNVKYLMYGIGEKLYIIKTFIVNNPNVLQRYKCLFKDYYKNKTNLGWTTDQFIDICENNEFKTEKNFDCTTKQDNNTENKETKSSSQLKLDSQSQVLSQPSSQPSLSKKEDSINRIRGSEEDDIKTKYGTSYVNFGLMGAGKRKYKTRKFRKSRKSRKSRKTSKSKQRKSNKHRRSHRR
jgi:hypothetical protein